MTTGESPTPGPRSLAGARALVVGANGLIGNAVVRLLAEAGARITIAGRDAGRLDELRSSLAGAELDVHPLDVRDDDAVHDLDEVDAVGLQPGGAGIEAADLEQVDQQPLEPVQLALEELGRA